MFNRFTKKKMAEIKKSIEQDKNHGNGYYS